MTIIFILILLMKKITMMLNSFKILMKLRKNNSNFVFDIISKKKNKRLNNNKISKEINQEKKVNKNKCSHN